MLALSWKHKFLLLIAVTLIGLALMTASAMLGFRQLSTSYNAIISATAYENTAQRLLAHWLRIEAMSAGLSEDNHIRLLNSLNTLPSTADQMTADAVALDDPDVTDAAKNIVDNMKQYVALRHDWLKNRRKLGWDTDMSGPFTAEQRPLVDEIRKQEARLELMGEGVASDIELLTSQLSTDIIATRTAQAEKVDKIANLVALVTSVAVALMLLITLIRISHRLNRRLSDIRKLLTSVAAGDLTVSVTLTGNRRDEFNQLGDTANQMVEGMATLIRRLVSGNRELSTLQQDLDSTMHRLGENSEQVEQQTEQAASATQEISMTVGEVAKRTAEVSRGSLEATTAAQSGAEIIAGSVDSMKRLAELIQSTHQQVGRLEESGNRVTSIIDMINGLADQTNLLALNAAIEAARAGDAGRGFSVVADEVRSLAQKTVDATTGISSIISEFSEQTRQMSQLMESSLKLAEESELSAENVAGTIANITQTITALSVDMEQVVVAVEQISATSEDIAGKMEQINQHTGATKTLRLSLDQNSQRLANQTQELNSASDRFQISY